MLFELCNLCFMYRASAIFRSQSNQHSSGQSSRPKSAKTKPQQSSLTTIGGELDRCDFFFT